MAIFNRYPYTDFQQLNLDWILQELKELTDEWAQFEGQYEGITANAQTVPYGAGASVAVTGGSGSPFNFDFNIPAGKDLKLTSSVIKYGTSNDINTQPGTWYDNPPAVAQGDYLWTKVTLNFNDGTQSIFYTASRNGLDGLGSVITVNGISPDGSGNVAVPVPQPSNSIPLMDTQYGSEGVSADYSRADHQHISDTSKLNVQSGAQVGDKNAYVVNDISTQTIQPISSSPVAGAIAEFDANGGLLVNEPLNDYEVPRLLDVKNGFVSNSQITNYVAKTDKATVSSLGIVQPDGVSITIDSDGIISSVAGGMTVDTIWTNTAYPGTTSFSAQTLNLDISTYSLLGFEFFAATDVPEADRRTVSVIIPKDTIAPFELFAFHTGKLCYRTVQIVDSSTLAFSAGSWHNTYGTGSSSVNVCVPYKIYGIK